MPETIFSCRLAAVDSWVRTGRRAWTHTCFTSLYRYMQYKCREGLTVCSLVEREDQWWMVQGRDSQV